MMTREQAADRIASLMRTGCFASEDERELATIRDGLREGGQATLSLVEAKNRVEGAWAQFDRDRLPIITMIKLLRTIYSEGVASAQTKAETVASSRLMLAGALLTYVSDDDADLAHKTFLQYVSDRIYADIGKTDASRPVNENIISDIARRAVEAISDGWGEKEDATVAGHLEGYLREAARRA